MPRSGNIWKNVISIGNLPCSKGGMSEMKTNHLLICLIVLFVAGALIRPSYGRIDPRTVFALWLFDQEGAGTEEDVSGNGNDGEILGDPDWTEGKFGSALEFDGIDDYVDCDDRDSLDVGTDNFSIVVWIKCADYIPDQWEGQIVSKLHETAPRHGYLLGVRGALDAAQQTKPVFRFGLATDVSVHMFGTSPINDDVWHHLAVTVDRDGSMILYRDGEVESQMSIAGQSNENEDNDLKFRIGRHDQHGGFYKGLIDELALFRTVLDQGDIQRIMEDGLERSLALPAVLPLGKLPIAWGQIKEIQ